MEDDRTSLLSTDAKQWERPWSTAEIRANSANWTLAGDTGLLHFLQEYAHHLLSRTHETEKLVNELVYKNKAIGAKVNNVVNDFQMLSNEQFIENRVYDEEIDDSKPSENVPELQKTKEQREAEMIPRVTEALNLGLAVLDQAFHKIQVEETSDSEEDESRVEGGRIVLEPKDPYEHRPLPFIIGSKEFEADDFVGLRDMYVEEFVEKTLDEESVSLASLSSSSLDESDEEMESPYQKDTPRDHVEEIVQSRNIERAKSSASEGSDLFDMEGEENDFASTLESEKKMIKENEQNKRLNTDDLVREVKSVTRNRIESDVAKVSPVSKQEKYDDDLFGSVESDNVIEDNSPFQKKPGGLFSTDLAFTNGKDDASDDDLFGASEKIPSIPPKIEPVFPPIVQSSKETEKKEPNLFAESEDESEDIFTTLSSKKSFSIPPPSSAALKSEQKETAKTSEKISSVPDVTKKKSINAFPDFGDKSSSDSLFGDNSTMEDLFVTKPEKKSSADHFMVRDDDDDDDDSDLFSSLNIKPSSKVEPKKESKVFQEQQPSSQQSRKREPTLFGSDDDDDDDLFGPTKIADSFASPAKDTSKMFSAEKETSKNTGSPKKAPLLISDPVKDVPKIADLLEETQSKIPETTKVASSKTFLPEKELFSNKSIVSDMKIPSMAPKSSDKIPNKKLSISEKQTDHSISFDEPAESHTTLNAINKGRAKIPGKRRKPTRKGRRASLSAENEDSSTEESTKKTIGANSSPIQNNLIFSESSETFDSSISEVTSSNVEITPKKVAPFGFDRSIMSKLVSEISNSQVGRKDTGLTHDSFEDEDDDIFSSAAGDFSSSKTSDLFATGDIGSSNISDFLSVSANRETIVEHSPISPVSKSEVSENKILDTDSILDDDDLFSEPAFKGFRTSITESDSMFGLDNEDDIFIVVEANKQKSATTSANNTDDIFGYSEEDIFAGVGKEKYELISNDVYDDDDDIFGNLDTTSKPLTSGSNTKKTSKVEARKAVPVDSFEDPLTGFSSD